MQHISPQKPNKNLPQTIPEEQHIMAKKIKNFIYNPNESIGSGFSSQVFRGINQINNEPIAIKAIQLNKVQNEVQRYLLSNQIAALKAVKHPNVINTVDILMTKNNVYIVTQYCEQGDLQKYIIQAKATKEKQPKNSPIDVFPIIHPYQALKLIEKILMGYQALEEKGILHRDLKTANIFLKRLNRQNRQGPPLSQIPDNLLQSTAKIADFGFCQMLDGDPAKRPQIAYNVGSPAYMSPQSYKQNFYSSKSDLWSIGIILYQMLMGDTPDRSLTYDQMADNLNQGKLKLPFVGIAGDHNNDNLRRIFTKCFKKNLNERYNSKAMLEDVRIQIQRLQKAGFGTYKNPPINELKNQAGRNSQTLDRGIRQQTPTYQSNLQKNFRSIQSNDQVKKMTPKNQDLIKNTFKSGTGSPSNTPMVDSNSNLRASIQMMLFLYRLLKFITDTTIKQATLTRLIIFRHRSFIQQNIGKIQSTQTLRQYQYLKSRFDETYVEKQTTQNNNSPVLFKLNQLANEPFASQNSMKVYKEIFKEACYACQHFIFGPAKTEDAVVDYNKIGIMWDYLILEYEILECIEKGQQLNFIIENTSLSAIVKQQPKKLVSAHYQLLKIKNQSVLTGVLHKKTDSDSHRKTKSQIFNTKAQQKSHQSPHPGQQTHFTSSIINRPGTSIPIENIVIESNQNPLFLRQTVDPEVLRQKYLQLDKFKSSDHNRNQQMNNRAGTFTINMHPQVRTQVRNQPFHNQVSPFQIQHLPQRKTFH